MNSDKTYDTSAEWSHFNNPLKSALQIFKVNVMNYTGLQKTKKFSAAWDVFGKFEGF